MKNYFCDEEEKERKKVFFKQSKIMTLPNFTTNISDLKGTLKYHNKEYREDWQLTRDAIHGELLKAIRAIDVMKGVAVSALKHSPPRTQAESLQRQREIERQKARSEKISLNLSKRRVTTSQPNQQQEQQSRSNSRSANQNPTSSSTTPRAGSQQQQTTTTLTPRAGSQNRAPSIPVSHRGGSQGNSNNHQQQQHGSPSLPPLHSGRSTIKTQQQDAPVPTDPRSSHENMLMETDPQLAFEAIAASQTQLDEALEILRTDPSKKRIEERIPMKVHSRSPPRSFYQHNDPDSPERLKQEEQSRN